MKKCWHKLLYADAISYFLQQGNVKKSEKQWKYYLEGENVHIFWMTWGISMRFSGDRWPMIILKVTGFHPLFRKYIFGITHFGIAAFGVLRIKISILVLNFSTKKQTVYDLLVLIAIYSPKNGNKNLS